MRAAIAILLFGALSGCLAQTALDVVTLPVKVVSKGVDLMTTSQSEADRNRGRALRKKEERERKEAKRAEGDREKEQSQPEAQ